MTDTDKKIRFGFVGTSMIADWMIAGALYDARFVPVAIYSRSEETAARFAAMHNIPEIYTSLEAMAASDSIDAVYIASPNSLHAAQSILFMEHGKHVLCEKPLASNHAEALLMAETSKRYTVTLMEAMKSTLTPNFTKLRANMHRMGTIRRYFASYCQYSSRYDKLKEGKISNVFNPDFSGGSTMDLGIYTIYPMVALFGMPTNVMASGITLPCGVDGQASAIFRYKDMEGVVTYSKITDSRLPSEIEGEGGTAVFDSISTQRELIFHPHAGNKYGGIREKCEAENWTVTYPESDYYYVMKEFIDVILSGETESAVNSHRNSLDTLTILDEIRRQLGVTFPADRR